MVMERSLVRLALRACSSSAFLQRGAALASQQAREYVASSSPSDSFPRTEFRESLLAKNQSIWQGWTRHYSAESSDAPQGNVEYLEFGTHKKVAAKRFAVGTTAVDPDKVEDEHVVEETKEKAKEILQAVGEQLDETVEKAKIRQLQQKLASTEGIGEVVQELYNQQEEHVTEFTKSGIAGGST